MQLFVDGTIACHPDGLQVQLPERHCPAPLPNPRCPGQGDETGGRQLDLRFRKLLEDHTHIVLTYEAVAQLTELELGQSTAVGIGGDPVNGLKHLDALKLFNDDPETDAVIMIGEIGSPDEAEAAIWCKANMKKPIVGFIAGVTAPAGKRMGHAGALISGGADTADAKLEVMEACGFTVTRNPSEMGKLLKALLK